MELPEALFALVLACIAAVIGFLLVFSPLFCWRALERIEKLIKAQLSEQVQLRRQLLSPPPNPPTVAPPEPPPPAPSGEPTPQKTNLQHYEVESADGRTVHFDAPDDQTARTEAKRLCRKPKKLRRTN